MANTNISFLDSRKGTQLLLNDLSCVREKEDYARLDLNCTSNYGKSSIVKNFDSMMNWVKSLSTIGGTIIGGKDCTFRDISNPIMVLKIKGMHTDKNVTTYFLIRKEDLYVVGYCLQNDWRTAGNWILANKEDSFTKLQGAKYAVWGCNYQWKLDGELTREQEKKLKRHLGRECIIFAMSNLHSDTSNEKLRMVSFHAIAHNISEACRFTRVAKYVKTAIRKDKEFDSKEIEKLELVFNNWSAATKILIDLSIFGKLSTDQWSKLQDVLGVNSIEELMNLIFIAKRENPKQREQRRLNEQQNIANYKREISIETIQRMLPGWQTFMRTLSPEDEKLKRMTELCQRWYYNVDASRVRLKKMRNDELKRLMEKGGRTDIWNSSMKALQADSRYFLSILGDTDIIVLHKYLRKFVDDQGRLYEMDELLLCDPY